MKCHDASEVIRVDSVYVNAFIRCFHCSCAVLVCVRFLLVGQILQRLAFVTASIIKSTSSKPHIVARDLELQQLGLQTCDLRSQI